MPTQALSLDVIILDCDVQSRVSIDEPTVAEYAERIQEGDEFPPPLVLNDGSKYWLVSGFHRIHAYRRAGILEVECIVQSGTKRDAIILSAASNADHGLRRTNADKARAVQMLLKDETWRKKPDREIAEHARVSHTMVSNHRAKAGEESPAKKKPPETAKDYQTIGNGCQNGHKGPDSKPEPQSGNGCQSSHKTEPNTGTEEYPFTAGPAPDADPADFEEPAPKGAVLDGLKRVVPKNLIAVFNTREEFERLARQLHNLLEPIEVLANGDVGTFLFPQDLRTSVENAKVALRRGAPFAVCPYCKGKKKYEGKPCFGCKAGGWVNKAVYETAPPEMKYQECEAVPA